MLLEIRPQARRDLHSIARFLKRHSRESAVARRFTDRLVDRCEDLLKAHGMGTPYSARPGVIKLNQGAYKIFYRVTDSKVIVLRIWDGRRENDPLI